MWCLPPGVLFRPWFASDRPRPHADLVEQKLVSASVNRQQTHEGLRCVKVHADRHMLTFMIVSVETIDGIWFSVLRPTSSLTNWIFCFKRSDLIPRRPRRKPPFSSISTNSTLSRSVLIESTFCFQQASNSSGGIPATLRAVPISNLFCPSHKRLRHVGT